VKGGTAVEAVLEGGLARSVCRNRAVNCVRRFLEGLRMPTLQASLAAADN